MMDMITAYHFIVAFVIVIHPVVRLAQPQPTLYGSGVGSSIINHWLHLLFFKVNVFKVKLVLFLRKTFE